MLHMRGLHTTIYNAKYNRVLVWTLTKPEILHVTAKTCTRPLRACFLRHNSSLSTHSSVTATSYLMGITALLLLAFSALLHRSACRELHGGFVYIYSAVR